MSDDYTYETKCRRCSKICEWHFAKKSQISWLDFVTAVSDYIESPRSYYCKKCKKLTVQEIVSFTAEDSV